MNAALLLAGLHALLVSGLGFEEVEVPGTHVSTINEMSGTPIVNFRHGDFDGDGFQDLVVPPEVFLQRNGAFPVDARVPLPCAPEHVNCDVGRDAIYLRTKGRLQVVRWRKESWESVIDQPIAWPNADDHTTEESVPDGPCVRLERFLQDMDSDGVPEIVLADGEGLHVYARGDDAYSEAGCANIFPPLSLWPAASQQVWPPDARTIALPTLQMSCSFFLEGNTATILTRESCPEGQVRYRAKRVPLDPAAHYAPIEGQTREELTEAMPNYLQPCRLNSDGVIDYAGTNWKLSDTSPLPCPILETRATTDGGKTFDSVRTRSFRPRCSFVDFDGDGDLDMVTETSGLFNGGIRESVARFASSRDVEHAIAIHLQDAKGRFSKRPGIEAPLTFRLDAPPCRNTHLFQRYGYGSLLDVTGDFNGDGYRDLTVHERPERLAIYFGGPGGFSSRPAATLPTRAAWFFGIADVDGDGRSDVLFRWYEDGSGEPDGELVCKNRVHLARETE